MKKHLALGFLTSISPQAEVQNITPEQVLQYLQDQENGEQYANSTISSVLLVEIQKKDVHLTGALVSAIDGLKDKEAYIMALKLISEMKKKNIAGVASICEAISSIHIIKNGTLRQSILFEAGDSEYLQRDGTVLRDIEIPIDTETIPFDAAQKVYEASIPKTQEATIEIFNHEADMYSEKPVVIEGESTEQGQEENMDDYASMDTETVEGEVEMPAESKDIVEIEATSSEVLEKVDTTEYVIFQPDEKIAVPATTSKVLVETLTATKTEDTHAQGGENESVNDLGQEAQQIPAEQESTIALNISYYTTQLELIASDIRENILHDAWYIVGHEFPKDEKRRQGRLSDNSFHSHMESQYDQYMTNSGAKVIASRVEQNFLGLERRIFEVQSKIRKYHNQDGSVGKFTKAIGAAIGKKEVSRDALAREIKLLAQSILDDFSHPEFKKDIEIINDLRVEFDGIDYDIQVARENGNDFKKYNTFEQQQMEKNKTQDQITGLEETIDNQAQTITQLSNRVIDLESQVKTLRALNLDYIANNNQLQRDLSELTLKIQGLNTHLSAANDENIHQAQEQQVLLQTISALEYQIQGLNHRAHLAGKTIGDKELELQALSEQAATLELEKNSSDAAVGNINQKLAAANQKITQLIEEITVLNSEIGIGKGLVRKSTSKLNESIVAYEKQSGYVAVLETERAINEAKLRELNSQIELSRSRKNNDSAEMSILVAENDKLKLLLKEKDEIISKKNKATKKYEGKKRIGKIEFIESNTGARQCSVNTRVMIKDNTIAHTFISVASAGRKKSLLMEDGTPYILQGHAVYVYEYNKQNGIPVKTYPKDASKSTDNITEAAKKIVGNDERVIIDLSLCHEKSFEEAVGVKKYDFGHRLVGTMVKIGGEMTLLVKDPSHGIHDWITIAEYFKNVKKYRYYNWALNKIGYKLNTNILDISQ